MTHSLRFSLHIICLLPVSPQIFANQDDPFFEMPVVLSASRLEQPTSETPVAISIIDRQLIEATGARTIPEVLRLVPGMVVGNSVNEFGDEPKIVVAYHGHTDQYSKQMQVLIDGRSIYEPMLGGVAWNMIPINMEDIERIEVSRGPNAASYGSNSFLAAVNIITRQAIEDQGQLFKVAAGNHSIRDATYRYADSVGDMDYRMTVSSQNDDGQDREDGVKNNDDLSAQAFDYRMDYQINSRSQLTYQGGYQHANVNADQNYASDGIRLPHTASNVNAHQHIKYENNISSKDTVVLQYYYNLLSKDDKSNSRTLDPALFGATGDPYNLLLDFGLKSQRHNLEATHYTQFNDDVRFIWGGSGQLDLGQSEFFFGSNEVMRRKTYRIFSNLEWHVTRDDILNFGFAREKIRKIGYSSSPRLAYIHKFTPQHSLRLSVSKAVRSPFLVEEYGDMSYQKTTSTGDTISYRLSGPEKGLKNEEIISRDIGYYGRYLNDDLLINARIYKDTLSHLIRQDYIPGNVLTVNGSPILVDTIPVLVNDNSTSITGIEIEVDYYVDPSLRLTAAASELNITSNDINITDNSRQFVNSAPHQSGSLLAIKQFNKTYSGSLGYYRVGRFSWIDARSDNSNDYHTVDLRITRHLQMSADKGSISLTLKNLSGDYSNYDKSPGAGPRIIQSLTAYLELKLQFR